MNELSKPLQEIKHPTEVKLPIQTTTFKNVLDQMYKIHLDKNKDYSPANILVAGQLGVIIRIWDKFCRICNLMGMPFPALGPDVDRTRESVLEAVEACINNKMSKEECVAIINKEFGSLSSKAEFDFSKFAEQKPANEPLDDAWLDMANYSIIGYINRKGAWGR